MTRWADEGWARTAASSPMPMRVRGPGRENPPFRARISWNSPIVETSAWRREGDMIKSQRVLVMDCRKGRRVTGDATFFRRPEELCP